MGGKNGSGAFGEQKAAEYLAAKGAVQLGSNYHSRFGEIDLIFELSGYLLFVEVKTRSKNSIAAPREWVTPAKQKKIILTAMQYLTGHSTEKQPRFDVIEVVTPSKDIWSPCEIFHIENAFDLGGFH